MTMIHRSRPNQTVLCGGISRSLILATAVLLLSCLGCNNDLVLPSELGTPTTSNDPSSMATSQTPANRQLTASIESLCVKHNDGSSKIRVRVRIKTPFDDDRRIFAFAIRATGPNGLDVTEQETTERVDEADGADNVGELYFDIKNFGEYTFEITTVTDQKGRVAFNTQPKNFTVGRESTCP